jgi:hypothetical protein
MLRLRQCLVLLAVLVGIAATAFAGPATVTTPVLVSGASPFAPDGCGVDTNLLHSEHDATLAVDPADTDHLVAIWQQDNMLSSVAGVSLDGGASWQRALVPGLTTCTGSARWTGAFDPWISIGPDGTVYMSSVVNGPDPVPNPVAQSYGVAVSRSADGGLTWSEAQFPIELPVNGLFLDKSAVTADQTLPGSAYVVTTLIPNVVLLSRTTDHGETWTDARPIYVGKPGFASFGAEIVSLPDGTLLTIFTEWPLDFFAAAQAGNETLTVIGENEVLVMRSQDGGETWSLPSRVATFPPWVARDPESGASVVFPWRVVRSAIGSDGSVWVAWDQVRAGDARIRFTRSTDGGVTWSAPADVVATTNEILKPTIAISGGTVGVTFYDFRNDTPGDGELTTDVWLRHSHDGGASWEEAHLGGPFDLREVPISNGNGIPTGDYAGLVPLAGEAFGALFQRGNPPETVGATDVFFARVAPAP